jgi:drug/metabolite transporter (DMT)-like permease
MTSFTRTGLALAFTTVLYAVLALTLPGGPVQALVVSVSIVFLVAVLISAVGMYVVHESLKHAGVPDPSSPAASHDQSQSQSQGQG